MNEVLQAVLFAFVLAQGGKLVFLILKNKRVYFKDLALTGGMPSSHSAVVVSLALSILFTEGLSTSFIIATTLAIIVIRDALGVRRTAGEEGTVILSILSKLNMKKQIHIAMGHKPKEVIVGSILGILASILINML